MKNSNKIILIVVLLLVAFSLSYGFKKYVIDKDFYVYMLTPCLGQDISCFVSEESEEPYLKVYRKAVRVEQCVKGECDPFVCEEDEIGCITISCSEEELEEDESCNLIQE